MWGLIRIVTCFQATKPCKGSRTCRNAIEKLETRPGFETCLYISLRVVGVNSRRERRKHEAVNPPFNWIPLTPKQNAGLRGKCSCAHCAEKKVDLVAQSPRQGPFEL